MGRIRNAIGRYFQTPIPPGTTRKAFVRGSVKRREDSFNNRLLGFSGDLDVQNDVVASILNSMIGDLVGTGIKPTIDTGNLALDERLRRLFAAWSEDAEVTGLTWDDSIELACRFWLRDGEAFIVLTDSGRIMVLGPDDLPATPANQGIECDPATGRPTAYIFKPDREEIRVDAQAVMHLAYRTGRSLRGVSPLTAAWPKIRDLMDFSQAEGRSAANSARFAVVLKTEGGAGGPPVLPRDEDGNLDELPDGMVFDRLQPGESVEVVKPGGHPNPNAPDWSLQLTRAIAAAVGGDPVQIARNAPGSYSSSRSLAVIAARDSDARFARLARMVIQPLWKLLLSGWLERSQVALTEATRWQAFHPEWLRAGRQDWIDPLRQSQSLQILLDSGLASKEELRQHFSGFGQSGANPPTPPRRESQPNGGDV